MCIRDRFSFNSPLGACPRCRGFGRIIEIDYRLAVHRVEELLADPGVLSGVERIFVVQDRIQIEPASMARFTEAVETAMHFGRGEVRVFAGEVPVELGHYSRGRCV